ncbi:hypothetical protein BKA65DRAFT_518107, partial [Rhexocercosporidium sp. MPI-PUGE-AT-0058]
MSPLFFPSSTLNNLRRAIYLGFLSLFFAQVSILLSWPFNCRYRRSFNFHDKFLPIPTSNYTYQSHHIKAQYL